MERRHQDETTTTWTGNLGGGTDSYVGYARDTVDRAVAVHEEASRLCYVASSVNFPVGHDPMITVDSSRDGGSVEMSAASSRPTAHVSSTPTADRSRAVWVGFVGYCDPTSTGDVAAYEDAVLALLPKHGGSVVVRGRRHRDQPTTLPAELHVLRFSSRGAFEGFLADPERHALLARFGDVFTDKIVVELDEPEGALYLDASG